nr:melanocortin receptor 3 [Hydra vulgaris]
MSVPWMVACIIIDSAVILANFVEQLLIVRKWKSLDRIDYLLLSLSISDFTSGVATLGIDGWYLSGEMNPTIVPRISHEIVTKIFDSVFLFSVFASTFHVIAVAVERFYAIKYPRKYYIFNTFKIKFGTIAGIWIISLILTPTFSVLSVFSLDTKIGVYIRACVFAFSAFFVLIVYLYISLLLVLQRKSIIQDFSPECNVQQDRLKRMTMFCTFIGISFVVCLMPITVSYFDEDLYHPIGNLAITLNSLINPCIYFAKVIYESRSINRSRNETTHALLESRSYIITTVD